MLFVLVPPPPMSWGIFLCSLLIIDVILKNVERLFFFLVSIKLNFVSLLIWQLGGGSSRYDELGMRLESHIYQVSDWLEIFPHSCGAPQRMIPLSDARIVHFIFFLINTRIKYCLFFLLVSFPCSLVMYGLQWQWQNLIQSKNCSVF